MKIPRPLIAIFIVTGFGLIAFQNCGGAKKTQDFESPSVPLSQEIPNEKTTEIRVQKVVTGNTSYCRYSDSTALKFAFENAGVLIQRTGGDLPGPGLTYEVTVDPGCGLSVAHKSLTQDGYQIRFEHEKGATFETSMPDYLERRVEFREPGTFRIVVSTNTKATAESWLSFCPLQLQGTTNQGVCGTAGIRMFVRPGVSPFPGDVPLDSVAVHHIDLLKQKRVTVGYSESLYGAADPVTRIQLAVFLSRLATGGRIDNEVIPQGSNLQIGSSCPSRLNEAPLLTSPPRNPTTDTVISQTDILFKYVRCMDYLEVPIGFSKVDFRPNETISRKEAALAIMVAFAGSDPAKFEYAFRGFPVKDAAPTFLDVLPTGPTAGYRDAILLFKKYGVTLGIGGNQFGVDAPLNREAAATFSIRTFTGAP